MAKKERELSPKAKAILELLKNSETPMTLADIKDNGIENPNGSHLKALENRGLVVSEEIEVEVVTTRKVKSYQVVSPTETE